jgi:hypothetical protein
LSITQEIKGIDGAAGYTRSLQDFRPGESAAGQIMEQHDSAAWSLFRIL